MSEKWECVVKGGKHKSKSQMSIKEIKQFKENNLNGNKYSRGADEETDHSISPESNKLPSKIKSKSKSHKGESENSLNQQISKLNSEDIKLLHKELTDKFPSQHTVVLMDLALHLNLMIKPSEDSLKNLNFDNIDFPYGLLLNDSKSALRGVFTTLNNVQLGNFLKSAMIQIVDDNEKGIKSIGLMLLVQVCLKMKPTALIANRKSIFELMNLYREQTVKFKCMVWVLKQACLNFNVACQIWLIYLLPFISQRCHTETVLLFGEEMMNYPTDSGGNDSALLHADFLPIVDLVFNQSNEADNKGRKGKKKQINFQLVPAHLQRLSAIYHKIKDQIFTSKATGSLKDYFASLFFRLSPNNKNEDFNKELLDCLDHCLIASPESVKVLEHIYAGNLQQTKIFLEHFKSGKSRAATVIMKQKPYRTMIDKIHGLCMSATADGVLPSLRSQDITTTKNTHLSTCCTSIGGCMATVAKVALYTGIVAVFVAVLLNYQYPQQYKSLEKKLRPVYDSVWETSEPYYKYGRSRVMAAVKVAEPYVLEGAHKVQVLSGRLWSVSGPYVQGAVGQMEEMAHYLYAKAEEVAPDMLDKVGRGLLSVEKYARDSAVALDKYLRSDEVANAMKAVSATVGSVSEQVSLGYRAAVAYMLRMVGY